ncbi:hypothetical protein KC357_g11 [Hortaea werneckii]|nr:hypothetical protein KC357_g11 [Hortaea werneckii]
MSAACSPLEASCLTKGLEDCVSAVAAILKDEYVFPSARSKKIRHFTYTLKSKDYLILGRLNGRKRASSS